MSHPPFRARLIVRLSFEPTRQSLQHRLDDYRDWYNRQRPHQALGRLTPDEAHTDQWLPEPMAFHAADPQSPAITVERLPYRGDPRLPSVSIRLAA